MDAGRIRRETGSLCHSVHGLTRVMAVAVRGFQAYFDVLILVLNIIGYGEDRRDLCTPLARELRNIIERASLLCDGNEIQLIHLPEEVRNATASSVAASVNSTNLKQLERQTLENRLAHHRGSRKKLADELGISERTLYRRLKEFEE